MLLRGTDPPARAGMSDVIVDGGVKKEACPLRLAPTASTTAALAMGDALAVALMEAQGFTEKDFALFHPAGELGRRLHLKVADIMRKGSHVPRVGQDASFPKIVREINAKKVGSTCVTGKGGGLKGIIVDGDLRRAMLKNPDVSRWNAENLRTPHPTVVSPELPLAQALHLMEDKPTFHLTVPHPTKPPPT